MSSAAPIAPGGRRGRSSSRPDGNRARAYRRALGAGRTGGEPAGASGAPGRLADRRDRPGVGHRLHPARLVGRPPGWRRGDLRDRPDRRQRARGAAAGDHPRPGGRRSASSSARAPWSSASARSRRSGSTDVICTDKTGTLTENRMRVTAIWSAVAARSELECRRRPPRRLPRRRRCRDGAATTPASPMAAAERRPDRGRDACRGAALGGGVDVAGRSRAERVPLRPGPQADVDRRRGRRRALVHTKGAPEAVLPCCTMLAEADGRAIRSSRRARAGRALVDELRGPGPAGARGRRRARCETPFPQRREEAERDLVLLGLVAMVDPPRPRWPRRSPAVTAPGSGSSSSPATTR